MMMDVTILIADSHDIVRAGMRSILEKNPRMRVVAEAEDGRTAIDYARELSPDFVLLDLAMPGLNGIDATHHIAGLDRPKVILLSASSDQELVHAALRAGASGFLLKSSAATELIGAIETVMAGRVALSATIDRSATENVVRQSIGRHRQANPHGLTPREREVLQLVAEGKTTREISELLHVSVKTIEAHRTQIMSKLNVRSIANLTKFAIRNGITSV